MGVVLLTALPFLIVTLLLAVRGQNEKQPDAREHWTKLLQGAGLKVEEQSDPLTARGVLEEVEGVEVEAELTLYRSGSGESSYPILRSRVSARSKALAPGLQLRGDVLWTHPLVEESEQAFGDPRFDGKLEPASLDAHACAALSHEARELLAPFLEQGGRVEQGKVVWESDWTQQRPGLHPWLAEEEPSPLLGRLRQAAELARALSFDAEELHRRLARNATQDPARKLRLRNLSFLAASETMTPPLLLASTARALLADDYVPVRLLAARQLGTEGHAVLRAVAADSQIELPLRLQAIQHLGAGAAPDLAGLKALLTSPRPPEVHCAALAALPAGAGALLDTVLTHTQSQQETVRAAAARALGVLALPDAERALLQLLSDDSGAVQHASAQALGAFGSVAAVEHLLPLSRAFLDTQLRHTARAAVASIQARLGDVEAGRVSLAQPHELAGALALADGSAARSGGLSLSEEPPEEPPPGSAAAESPPLAR